MPKISDPVYPSLTGANVANGDELYIVDVGTPNVSKNITADELAQAPQFSSRYVSKTTEDNVRWLGVGDLEAFAGTPTVGNAGLNAGNAPFWMLDASAPEAVAGSIMIPSHWTTFKVEAYWCNVSSSSGDVRWYWAGGFGGDGQDPDNSGTNVASNSQTIAAPTTTRVIKVSQFPAATNITNASGKPFFTCFYRFADNVADTLANDAGLYGVLLTRVS